MSKQRASIFGDEIDVDVSSFSAKRSVDNKAPTRAQVKAVTETTEFKSREVPPSPAKPESKRSPRVHRTGRNVQFNVKASQETIDQIYAITDAHPGWVLGYTLERAVAALARELEAAS
jgi:hypothetical protein